MLRLSDGFFVFEADHLTHQLQTATRALEAGADDELVLGALFHDVGEIVAGPSHAMIAATLLRPYVRPDVFNIVRTHQDFQGRYYNAHIGLNEDAYLEHSDQPWFDLALTFSEDWDQCSFDPSYATKSLDYFLPMVERMLATASYGTTPNSDESARPSDV